MSSSIPLEKCFNSQGQFETKNLKFGNVSKEYSQNRYSSMQFIDPISGKISGTIECILKNVKLEYNAAKDGAFGKTAQVPILLDEKEPTHKMLIDFLVAFSDSFRASLKTEKNAAIIGELDLSSNSTTITTNVGVLNKNSKKIGKNGLAYAPILSCVNIPMIKFQDIGNNQKKAIDNPTIIRNIDDNKKSAFIIDFDIYSEFKKNNNVATKLTIDELKVVKDKYLNHMKEKWTFEDLKKILKAGTMIPYICFHITGGIFTGKSTKPNVHLHTLYYKKSNIEQKDTELDYDETVDIELNGPKEIEVGGL